MPKVLFVNQEVSQCGVYQFGKNTAFILSKHDDIIKFDYLETDNKPKFDNYDLVILNHHPCTMPWVNEAFFLENKQTKFAMIMHDTRISYPNVAILHPDPTFQTSYPDFKIGRPVLQIEPSKKVLENTIGSFGFGFEHKGFDDLINLVNNNFEYATIRIHIPLNSKVDTNGYYAFSMTRKLKKLPKPGITLEITNDYKTESELLHWLSENTINAFLYKNTDKISEGCSSTVDWAIAAKRPFVVSSDRMFRHVWSVVPEVCIDNSSLLTVMNNGIAPLQYFYDNWTERKLYEEYCEVSHEIIQS